VWRGLKRSECPRGLAKREVNRGESMAARGNRALCHVGRRQALRELQHRLFPRTLPPRLIRSRGKPRKLNNVGSVRCSELTNLLIHFDLVVDPLVRPWSMRHLVLNSLKNLMFQFALACQSAYVSFPRNSSPSVCSAAYVDEPGDSLGSNRSPVNYSR